MIGLGNLARLKGLIYAGKDRCFNNYVVKLVV
jgi:hypothetical protein